MHGRAGFGTLAALALALAGCDEEHPVSAAGAGGSAGDGIGGSAGTGVGGAATAGALTGGSAGTGAAGSPVACPAPAFPYTVRFAVDDPRPQSHALFGDEVAGVGDVNGDGVGDLAVSAFGQHLAQPGAPEYDGEVFVVSGTDGSLLLTLDDPEPQDESTETLFGHSLQGFGDLDGDGLAEIAVGARRQDVGGSVNGVDQGAVFVFGSSDGRPMLTLTRPSGTISSWFGDSMAAGDFDADGVRDLVVAAPAWGSLLGAGFVISMEDTAGDTLIVSPDADSAIPDADPMTDGAEFPWFGWSLSASDDRVILGAPGQDVDCGGSVASKAGRAFLFSERFGLVPFQNPEHDCTAEWFGVGVAALGDLDGDGEGELAVAQSSPARVFVFSLASPETPLYALVGPDGAFGEIITSLDDLDGDGVSDFAVSARLRTTNCDGKYFLGSVFLYSGASGTLLTEIRQPDPGNGNFGQSLASLGDLDGNGKPELAVGAPVMTIDGNEMQGRTYVIELGGP